MVSRPIWFSGFVASYRRFYRWRTKCLSRVAARGLLVAFIGSIAFVVLWIGNPQASPGTGKVVFAGGVNILAVNADGTGLRR